MTVFVECNPDEVLVMTLGVFRKNLTHNNDKGRVCNSLSGKYTNSVGMIDEDPHSAQPTYLSILSPAGHQHNVKILCDKKRNNKVIILCPRLEEWLLKAASLSNINPSQYGLPNNPKDLHSELGYKSKKLVPLINDLVEAKNPAILFLKSQLS